MTSRVTYEYKVVDKNVYPASHPDPVELITSANERSVGALASLFPRVHRQRRRQPTTIMLCFLLRGESEPCRSQSAFKLFNISRARDAIVYRMMGM